MKVYIDITQLLREPRISGIQRAVIEHIKALYNDNVNLVLLNADVNTSGVYRFFKCDISKFHDVYIYKTSNKKGDISTNQILDIEEIVYGDVFLDLDLPLGSFDRGDLYKVLSENKVSIVTTVYDIIPILFPNTCDNSIVSLFTRFVDATITYAERIIVNTENTKNDINQYASKKGLSSKNISVVPLGSDYGLENTVDNKINSKIEKIVNGNKYLLSVGTIEPRKNHKYSFEAFKLGLFDSNINYVIVGKKGWKVDELYKEMQSHPQLNKSLFLLEDISDFELDYLYKNAYFTLFPTQYEGFGLPVVESIQRGVPVLTSDIPVMREVGKNAADYFDLSNPKSLVKLVNKYLDNENKYLEIKDEVAKYHVVSWDESGAYVEQALDNVEHSPRIEMPLDDSDEIYKSIEKNANYIRKSARALNVFNNENGNTSINMPNSVGSLDEILSRANQDYRVTSYYDLKTNRKFGKLILFAKKVIRKLNYATVEIPLENQTKFNADVVNYLNQSNGIIKNVGYDRDSIASNTERLNSIEPKNAQYEEKINELTNRIELLETSFKLSAELNATKFDNLNSGFEGVLQKVNYNFDEFVRKPEFEHVCVNLRNNNEILKSLTYLTENMSANNGFTSFSQCGEDMAVRYLCKALGIIESSVTYIDIGANHPKVNSNTYYFYTRGARGVLVEPNKDLLPLLTLERPEDTLLNCCVDLEDGKVVELFKANLDGGLSTINADIKENVLKENEEIKFELDSQVTTMTANNIIENILGCTPDLISLDVEGNEMRVLNSIDFDKYRPKFFIIEMIDYSTQVLGVEKNSEIFNFMISKGYTEYCFNGVNSIFVDMNI